MELVDGVGWGNTLLAAQLLRLMACVDVFLESAGSIGIAPPEFPRDKIFFQPVRWVTHEFHIHIFAQWAFRRLEALFCI
jgi:hypothetical protein